MVLARIAALPDPVQPLRVLLTNVPGSVTFFARFGFSHQGQMPARPGGPSIDVSAAMLDSSAWRTCRDLTRESKCFVDGLEVPLIDVWAESPNDRIERPREP